MTVPDSKDYLEKLLPGVSVEIIQNWKGQRNNRYEFSKPGIEKPAAILLAQSLNITAAMLDDIAVAVNKKFDSAPVSIPESLAPEAVTTEDIATNEVIKTYNKIERDLYEAAKKVVEAYERKNPMT